MISWFFWNIDCSATLTGVEFRVLLRYFCIAKQRLERLSDWLVLQCHFPQPFVIETGTRVCVPSSFASLFCFLKQWRSWSVDNYAARLINPEVIDWLNGMRNELPQWISQESAKRCFVLARNDIVAGWLKVFWTWLVVACSEKWREHIVNHDIKSGHRWFPFGTKEDFRKTWLTDWVWSLKMPLCTPRPTERRDHKFAIRDSVTW